SLYYIHLMKNLALHWKILIAMVLGIVWAIISGAYGFNEFTGNWIDPFGTIFINCLKFIAVPLGLFSIITGVAGLGDPSQLGRMGAKTLGMYLITTVVSVSIGLLIVNVFQPGKQNNEETRLNHRLEYEMWAADNSIQIKDGRHELATATPEQLQLVREKLNRDIETEEY